MVPAAWANEMKAIDLKEEAQRMKMNGRFEAVLLFQAQGYFERALPLMLKSVSMRENSDTLCLSLSELAGVRREQLLHNDITSAVMWRA